jgi:hypothetical protein
VANRDGLPRLIRFHDRKKGKIRWVERMPEIYRSFTALSEPEMRTTTVLKTQPPADLADCLFHELCHHAMYPLQPLRRVEMSGGLDEAAIKTLASHLVELWKLNPDLFLWIHQNLTGQEIVDAEDEDGG